jgi:mannose-6-phosphate isomerase-like protein (cupin superfamily)
MQAYELADLIARQTGGGRPYLEFARLPSLSAGVYRLPAGGVDAQQPHSEDEVYYVIAGRGAIRVGAEDRAVQAGSAIVVEAGVEHRFHSITEDLTVLVLFAPAEYSRAPQRPG